MIIAVTSPVPGVGRTLISVNIANRLHALVGKQNGLNYTNILDLNKSNDISYYLNSAIISRGLDDFCRADQLAMFKEEDGNAGTNFVRKVFTRAAEGLYFTGAPSEFKVTEDIAADFIDHSREVCRNTVIDCGFGADKETRIFCDLADYVVVVLRQDKRSTNTIAKQLAPFYAKYGQKLVFIINEYIGNMGTKVTFDEGEIKKEMLQARLNGKYFRLPVAPNLINDANDSVLLNYTNRKNEVYVEFLDNMLKYLMGV